MTNADVTGKCLADDNPVFVLMSSRTFSGGEEFTNNLKALKRATIVGETTRGGAHPVPAPDALTTALKVIVEKRNPKS